MSNGAILGLVGAHQVAQPLYGFQGLFVLGVVTKGWDGSKGFWL